jgi:hypothetical protein
MKKRYSYISIVKGRPRHPQSQGYVGHGNAPIKEALSRWMEENGTDDWTMSAYIVNNKIKECATEARGN